MKTLTIILSVIGLVNLTSCNQENNPHVLLEDAETRKEIFTSIAGNPGYMGGFMKSMHNNSQATQMMQDEGMRMMMKDSMMMRTMVENKPMMSAMMGRMVKSQETMGSMMQMMHEQGLMSEDCMISCTKMMGEKAMNKEKMNKKDSMGPSTKDEHAEHH